MRQRSRLIVLALALVVAVGAGGWYWTRDYLRAGAMLAQAADLEGWPRLLVRWNARQVVERAGTIETRQGPAATRLYLPQRPARRTVVLVSGVHDRGIDEPRLQQLSRAMASVGVAVLTPEIAGFRDYQVRPRATDLIADVALWATGRPELAPDGRVGLMGISFGGGLSVVAAGRDELRDRLAFVLSFGGHGDLPRALEHLSAGIIGAATHRIPSEYGLAIVLLNVAERLVPDTQLDELRGAIREFLRPDADRFGLAGARAGSARMPPVHRPMPEPSATLLGSLVARDTGVLGPWLLPHVMDYAAAVDLSPERSTPTRAPVFLLHGAGDDIIPATEAVRLAEFLQPVTSVQLLITPIIGHTGVERSPRTGDVLSLVSFLAMVLRL
jgi:dienelactone hydrolase